MSSYLNFSSRVMMGAAIVGIVGAAGVFIYEQIYAEKRRAMLVREVARLDKQVTSMRTELEALRDLQKESEMRRLKQRKPRRERKSPVSAGAGAGDAVDGREMSYASDSEYFTDYQSVVGTDVDMDSEEFYDVADTDGEDDTLRETSDNHLANSHESSPSKVNSPKSPKKNSTQQADKTL